MGLSSSKSQPIYPLPNPALNPNQSAFGYPPFGFFNPGQGGRKKDRANSYGMYPPPPGLGYGYPVYPSYPPTFQGYGYPGPAFLPAPQMQAPFVPPPPVVRAPTDPGPPVFVQPATQNPNPASVQSPPVIPSSTRRRSATPHPSAIPLATAEPQPQVQRPTPASDHLNRVLDPLPPAHAAAFGPYDHRSRSPIKNPLPPPPRDVYDSTPYRGLLNLPQATTLLTSTYGSVNRPAPKDGSSVGRKSSLKGLIRSLSSKNKREDTSVPFIPVLVSQPQATTATPPTSVPISAAVPATAGDPIRFDHQGIYEGFMNHSRHRVLYQNKTYPSALHLHEALKFIGHRPDLSEKIRNCPQIQDVYPLSATLQEFVRPEWGQIFLKMMEDVLYLKFKQHPDLRSLLMNTGTAPLIYAESNDTFWGDGPAGQGGNELGKTLVRVRDRLRAEGQGT